MSLEIDGADDGTERTDIAALLAQGGTMELPETVEPRRGSISSELTEAPSRRYPADDEITTRLLHTLGTDEPYEALGFGD